MILLVSHVINTVLSATLLGLILYIVLGWDETLTKVERLGLCLWGSAVLLSLASIWAYGRITPYSQWYQWVWRLGGILYLSGRARRVRRHFFRNESFKDIARDHLERKR